MLFIQCWEAPIARVCIENPIGCMSTLLQKPDQIIQPYQFGDDASKATCLWLRGLPKLPIDPTKRREGRKVWNYNRHKWDERWANQTDSGQNKLGPSKDRAEKRAKTYPGIGLAMAETWGKL